MSTLTLVLNESERNRLRQLWIEDLQEITPPYALFQLRPENCVITAYTSGKVVFQGKDAEVYASSFDASVLEPKKESMPRGFFAHAGSDEVGTGDYFGPVCVAACYIDQQSWQQLSALGIQDSKQLTDELMLKIAPEIMAKIPYSLLILENEKYNAVQSSNNLNEIKAKLHNQAYLNLRKKMGSLPDKIIIDQFTPEKTYYRYLSREKEVVGHIHFETKAESKYAAVAAASIIARYGFLKTWSAMEEKYSFRFTKGAGTKVDLDAQRFVDQFGFKELSKVAKVHFKNTDKLRKAE